MLLDGFRLKLARAQKHLETLEFEIGRYLRSDPYSMVRHLDTEALQSSSDVEYFWVGHVLERPPYEWNLLLGDMLHNWRSGLDALAWQLALGPNGQEPPEGTSFPIFERKRDFFAKHRDGQPSQWGGEYKIRGLPVDAQKVIVDEQPYHRGDEAKNDPLWLLQVLSNQDKHSVIRQLRPSLTECGIKGEGAVHVTPLDVRLGPFNNGQEIARARVRWLGREPQPHVKLGTRRDVAFAEEGPAAGQPVVPALRKIAQRVVDDLAIPLESYATRASVRFMGATYRSIP